MKEGGRPAHFAQLQTIWQCCWLLWFSWTIFANKACEVQMRLLMLSFVSQLWQIGMFDPDKLVGIFCADMTDQECSKHHTVSQVFTTELRAWKIIEHFTENCSATKKFTQKLNMKMPNCDIRNVKLLNVTYTKLQASKKLNEVSNTAMFLLHSMAWFYSTTLFFWDKA